MDMGMYDTNGYTNTHTHMDRHSDVDRGEWNICKGKMALDQKVR